MKNKLTGKALADYSIWAHSITEDQTPLPSNLFEKLQNDLIIEWFDSVGIWKNTFNNFYVKYFKNEMTLTEATNAAIEKANIIYNESKL